MEFSQKIIITGIIIPNNWDENGRIIGIALYTNTEEIYAVEQSGLIRDLMNLVRKKVEVKGKISEHPEGKKSIAVHNFVVIEDIVEKEEQ